ncbi:MAG TPA: ribonuclease P protein component [Lapillicoccus sp.]|nr:ribonuclease P protein component [Lapillicoccus sp.]
MLPARHRLRTAADFSATLRGAGAVRSGGRLLVLSGRYAKPAPTADAHDSSGAPHTPGASSASGDRYTDLPVRVGFVVSKAVGGAVIRNRTKRVLRHLVAARLHRIPRGCDLVVRANPAAAEASTAELGAELDGALDTVLRRLGSPAGVSS